MMSSILMTALVEAELVAKAVLPSWLRHRACPIKGRPTSIAFRPPGMPDNISLMMGSSGKVMPMPTLIEALSFGFLQSLAS